MTSGTEEVFNKLHRVQSLPPEKIILVKGKRKIVVFLDLFLSSLYLLIMCPV